MPITSSARTKIGFSAFAKTLLHCYVNVARPQLPCEKLLGVEQGIVGRRRALKRSESIWSCSVCEAEFSDIICCVWLA